MKDERVGHSRFSLVILLLVGGMIFFLGLNWGLPSRRVDPFLFGNHPVWSGKQVLSLLPVNENPDRPADVTVQIIGNRFKPILLNATDADRARIIRRYRLFSYQPDEITTFMGLSRMSPRQLDFDPRMYQYGGLWFYPVGALLKICSMVHLIDLRSDPAFYLDHPEEFAKFYLVDRSYTACWAILGIIVAFALVGRLGGDELEQCIAALGFIFLPVVIYMAHEAKPHLPGAVLALLAVLMGVRFIQTQRRRYGIVMSLCCGLAISMVLTNLPLLILIPIVYSMRATGKNPIAARCSSRNSATSTSRLLEKEPFPGRFSPLALNGRRSLVRSLFGVLGAIVVYLLLDPYVAIDFLWHRARLSASFDNSAAMYHFSFFGTLGNAIALIVSGVSLPVFLLGVAGVIVFALQRRKAILVLIAAGLLMAGPYFLFAAGKPAEYGRFALLPDLMLMLLAVRLLGGLPNPLRAGTMIAVLAVMGASGLAYWRGYLLDARPGNTRTQLANDLVNWVDGKNVSVALSAEPAPYSAPPMNLFDWQWVLLPRGQNAGPNLPYDFSISTVDTNPTPMSWADKQFAVYRGAGK